MLRKLLLIWIAVWTYELKQEEQTALACFLWPEGLKRNWVLWTGRNCSTVSVDTLVAQEPSERADTTTTGASETLSRPIDINDHEQYLRRHSASLPMSPQENNKLATSPFDGAY